MPGFASRGHGEKNVGKAVFAASGRNAAQFFGFVETAWKKVEAPALMWPQERLWGFVVKGEM